MAIAYIYVVLVISIGELLRKKLNYDITFTRKLIHLFAGFAAYTVPYYEHPWVAIIVAFTLEIGMRSWQIESLNLKQGTY